MHDAALEVDVGEELALDEVLVGERDVLQLHGHLQQRLNKLHVAKL